MNTRTPCVNSPHPVRPPAAAVAVVACALAGCSGGTARGAVASPPNALAAPAAVDAPTPATTPVAGDAPSSAPQAETQTAPSGASDPLVAPTPASTDEPAMHADPFARFDLAALEDRSTWYDRWPALAEPVDGGGLDCAPADFRMGAEIWTADLAPDRRVVGMLCQPGAYNFGFALFDVHAVDGGWAWQPLELPRCGDPPTAPQWQPVFLPTWDADRRTLHAFSKARGLGDCGETETWAFDGETFCLARCAQEHECNERLPPWEPLFADATCAERADVSP